MRVAARMGSILSTPRGFKRHVTDVGLIYEAMREDLRTPAMRMVDIGRFRNLHLPALQRESQEIPTGPPEQEQSDNPATEKAKLLARAGFTAIARLKAGKVLKEHEVLENGEQVYALQHDGFGHPLSTWGEMARDRIEDAVSSVVGCFGQYMADSKLEHRRMTGKEWIGCRLDKITFEHVDFMDCDFSGSWFEHCTFQNCTFNGCSLPAVGLVNCIMIECRFRGCDMQSVMVKGGTWNNVHVVDECDASGMFVSNAVVKGKHEESLSKTCEWLGAVEFRDVALSSAIMKNISLKGSLRVVGCTLWYAQLWRFLNADLNQVELSNCRLYGALVADYERLPERNRCGNNQVSDYAITRPPAET